MSLSINKVKQVVSSHTNQTIAVLFLVNGVSAIQQYIPETWLPLINGILSILAIYFRTNPRVDFTDEEG